MAESEFQRRFTAFVAGQPEKVRHQLRRATSSCCRALSDAEMKQRLAAFATRNPRYRKALVVLLRET